MNTLADHTKQALVSRLQSSLDHAVAALSSTPQEKLDYRPSDTAKSVRELGQHIVLGNNICLQSLGLPPGGDPEVKESSEIVSHINSSGKKLLDYAEQLEANSYDRPVNFFGNELPMVQFLMIAEWHVSRHCGQIDYLQTTWGDMEDRF